MRKKTIGIIGFGNMGSAIAERIKSKYNVFVFDIDRNKTKDLKNISVSNTIDELLRTTEVIILAIKPQGFDAVLNEIKADIDKKLVVSIAAGISTQFIEKILGEVSVIRVMPNLPARIGKGVSCLCKGKFASDKDLKSMLRLFKFLGITLVLGQDLMEAATAVCGSGPGFWGYAVKDKPRNEWKDYSEKVLIPQFILAAESIGFEKKPEISQGFTGHSRSMADQP